MILSLVSSGRGPEPPPTDVFNSSGTTTLELLMGLYCHTADEVFTAADALVGFLRGEEPPAVVRKGYL
jgi:hypothetical protein